MSSNVSLQADMASIPSSALAVFRSIQPLVRALSADNVAPIAVLRVEAIQRDMLEFLAELHSALINDNHILSFEGCQRDRTHCRLHNGPSSNSSIEINLHSKCTLGLQKHYLAWKNLS